MLLTFITLYNINSLRNKKFKVSYKHSPLLVFCDTWPLKTEFTYRVEVWIFERRGPLIWRQNVECALLPTGRSSSIKRQEEATFLTVWSHTTERRQYLQQQNYECWRIRTPQQIKTIKDVQTECTKYEEIRDEISRCRTQSEVKRENLCDWCFFEGITGKKMIARVVTRHI